MGRIRTVKPELFQHVGLYDAEVDSGLPLRLAFAGLFTCCDRAGRFKWLPRQLKIAVLPYDECDFSRVLDALATRGFLVKYTCGTEIFGCIPSWEKHQFINNKEAQSVIPEPSQNPVMEALFTREPRVTDATVTDGVKEGKGMEGNGRDLSASAELPEPLPMLTLRVVVGSLPLANGKEFEITKAMVEEWQNLHPAVDVMQQLRLMKSWCIANPKNRKTDSGVQRFIAGWLAKEQNKARPERGQVNHGSNQRTTSPAAERQQSSDAAIQAALRAHGLDGIGAPDESAKSGISNGGNYARDGDDVDRHMERDGRGLRTGNAHSRTQEMLEGEVVSATAC